MTNDFPEIVSSFNQFTGTWKSQQNFFTIHLFSLLRTLTSRGSITLVSYIVETTCARAFVNGSYNRIVLEAANVRNAIMYRWMNVKSDAPS